MDAKHTPGPWFFGLSNRNNEAAIIGDTDSVVCYLPDASTGCTFKPANARLIAAAPEMLDALRRAAMALAFFSETSPAARDDYNAVSAAIAKATQPEPTP